MNLFYGITWVVALLVASPAHAASFNCTKASGKFEKAICADAGLSAQDDMLAQAYAKALDGLTPDAKKVVENGQKSWLSYLKKTCSDMALNKDDLAKERTNCLAAAYEARIAELKDNREIGGLRFYRLDTFKATTTQAEKGDFGWKPYATYGQSLPQVDGDGAEARFFNAFVRKKYKVEKAVDATSDAYQSVSVTAVVPARVTLREDAYFYGHGAAHGASSVGYVHILWPEKRELKDKDVFVGKTWRKVLVESVRASLAKELGYVPDTSDFNKPDCYVFLPSRWSFAPDGLKVQFNEYEVASYAEGQPVAIVPWDVLKPYLQPQAFGILGIDAPLPVSATTYVKP